MKQEKAKEILEAFRNYAIKRSLDYSIDHHGGEYVDPYPFKSGIYEHVIERLLEHVSEAKAKDMFSYMLKEVK